MGRKPSGKFNSSVYRMGFDKENYDRVNATVKIGKKTLYQTATKSSDEYNSMSDAVEKLMDAESMRILKLSPSEYDEAVKEAGEKELARRAAKLKKTLDKQEGE